MGGNGTEEHPQLSGKPAPPAVAVRFHGALQDHLSWEDRDRTLNKPLLGPASIKDLLESMGVPHPEVGLILAGGTPVPFPDLAHPGTRYDVYAAWELPVDVPALPLRPPIPDPPRFVLDVHLGRLASYLRLLGFDTDYERDRDDPALAARAADGPRLLLTRDRGLLKRAEVMHGYWLRSTDSKEQAAEVLRRWRLAGHIRPFTRCLACNGMLAPVAKSDVLPELPPRVAAGYEEFHRCLVCQRVYWPGTHYERMLNWVQELTL